MPRIDPQQLLTCLSVLLSSNGGILSSTEVQRLANLMTKFSKKLVSKCVYVLILKSTETSLLGSFMGEGGWNLVHMWLQDAYVNKNWPLVSELLQLLLMTPVDVERLKMNNLPKVVKALSRREELPAIQQLSTQLVQLWLKIVKDETKPQVPLPVKTETGTDHKAPVDLASLESTFTKPTATDNNIEISANDIKADLLSKDEADHSSENVTSSTSDQCYKLAVRDGKQVLRKVSVEDKTSSDENKTDGSEESAKEKERKRKDSSEKSSEKSSSSKHKSSSSKSSSSSSSKDKSKSSSSSKDKDKNKYKSSSSSSSRDKSKDKDRSRDKDRKDKDKHRSNGSHKSNSHKDGKSSSSKERRDSKDNQAEKDKDTLAKIQPQSLSKLGRIPKKSDDKADDKKKEAKKPPSMSIEVRKNNEERPKTVKVFNSKMRSTGLLEEAKPPPPRSAVTKKPPPVIPGNLPVKRSSPVRDLIPPPEKKPKIEASERPGAIKLIPPKPKPVLLESDIFMDALNSAATANKKDVKKRKRRTSVNKEPTTPTETSPPNDNSSNTPPASPSPEDLPPKASGDQSLGLKNIAPFNFYQDTLSTEDDSKKDSPSEDQKDEDMTDADEENVSPNKRSHPEIKQSDDEKSQDENEKIPIVEGVAKGLKGVLLYSKKKGPKKSIRWKEESDLVEIQYFELDETERVNVTRAFNDMARMELSGEREALQLSRKTPNEDLMEIQTPWRMPYEQEIPASVPEVTCRSLEKDIQFAREKSVLQALYFSKRMIPDSPGEADPENHQMTDPVIIPLEPTDEVEQEEPKGITPWPDPKGSPPPVNMPPHNMHPMIPAQQILGGFPPHIIGAPQGPINPFQQQIQNFAQNMVPPTGVPQPHGFQGAIPQTFGTPGNFMGPNLLEWNMNMMQQQQQMGVGVGGEQMIPPQNGAVMFGPDAFGGVTGEHHGGFQQHFTGGPPHHQQNQMFPQQNAGHNNFPNRGGRGFRRGGGSNWMRMSGPGNWNSNRGGGSGGDRGGGGNNRGTRICKNIKNHGYCRNRDNCPFYHPNV